METINACSDTVLGQLVVLEGMPGAGKTTIVEQLAAAGCPVLGEYTTCDGDTVPLNAHPGVDEDATHQANWVRKTVQSRPLLLRHPAVVCDRDWLSALAYAYSTGDTGLLAARTAWAVDGLHDGTLLLADTYLLFDLDPQVSLQRRPAAPTGHPWSIIGPLRRLRDFYDAPDAAVGAHSPMLAALLRSRTRRHLSGHDAAEANLAFVRAEVAR
ncbi:AAA family ATPase [Planomonospora sp. ID82291]|uniref:AAA family ATPase n=1 Tax=Planomonospora sp. ID82291 TaxID=2738136 RepID=UPI0018C38A7E|nr:AAA family ATPase [Planomonospora sp. ID82291]MBG0818459.1 AAA family ATPase [Planomonospora sp. ID82291]